MKGDSGVAKMVTRVSASVSSGMTARPRSHRRTQKVSTRRFRGTPLMLFQSTEAARTVNRLAWPTFRNSFLYFRLLSTSSRSCPFVEGAAPASSEEAVVAASPPFSLAPPAFRSLIPPEDVGSSGIPTLSPGQTDALQFQTQKSGSVDSSPKSSPLVITPRHKKPKRRGAVHGTASKQVRSARVGKDTSRRSLIARSSVF
mmetsp:Transcript_14325/g.36914  ORF Transcript_14325/g.36914 Transcript_14325/m.36914 type:complete len:200 (+) Transcript_14325:990-1589(+)